MSNDVFVPPPGAMQFEFKLPVPKNCHPWLKRIARVKTVWVIPGDVETKCNKEWHRLYRVIMESTDPQTYSDVWDLTGGHGVVVCECDGRIVE